MNADPAKENGSLSPPGLMLTSEAGAYLDVRPSTLTTWRSNGQGPAYVKLGGLVRYRRADLDAFIAGNVRKAVAA